MTTHKTYIARLTFRFLGSDTLSNHEENDEQGQSSEHFALIPAESYNINKFNSDKDKKAKCRYVPKDLEPSKIFMGEIFQSLLILGSGYLNAAPTNINRDCSLSEVQICAPMSIFLENYKASNSSFQINDSKVGVTLRRLTTMIPAYLINKSHPNDR